MSIHRVSLIAVLIGAVPSLALAADPAPAATPAPAAGSPAPAAGSPAPAASTPTADAPKTTDEAFDVRVKGLEEQVNDIKEKIFRTKARLLLLQETVIGGDLTSTARAVIVHKNEMGNSFRLVTASYTLDDAAIYTKVDVKGDLADKDQMEIFNGRIVPGPHRIQVKLEYQGHGVGPITYLEGYKFKVTSNYTFDAAPGKVTTIQAIGFEKGGPFAELKDKPDVRYETNVSAAAAPAKKADGSAAPAASSAPAPAAGAPAP